jgi:hypothetical protein
MPLDDTIKEVPQADTEAIARRLMGDSLVDRYGDVIGARDTGVADVLRDFTIGFSQGQQKVDELHLKMQDTFRDQYNKAAERAVADKKLDMEKTSAAWEAVKWASEKAPRGYASGILKERLAQLGFEPTPTSLKMLADADFVAQLPKNMIDEAVANGNVNSTMLNAYFSDPMELDKFRNNAVERQRDEADTGRIILDTENKALKNKTDRAKYKDRVSARDQFVRSRAGTMQVTDEATGEKRPATIAEINALADQVFGKLPPRVAPAAAPAPALAAPVGLPQAPTSPLVGGVTTSTPTSSPAASSTVTPTTGLPQVAAAPAPVAASPAPTVVAPGGGNVADAKARLGLK